MSGPTDLHRAADLLDTARFGRSLQVLAQTESTNDDARRALAVGAPDGHTVVADTQSRGRGARGRVWLSPAGSDLYVSIAARPGLTLSALPPLTLAVGVGVCACVEALLEGARAEVKWPNDVLLNGAKIAGILVESGPSGDLERPPVVIGIGLNVGRASFPADLDFPATSMALEGRAPGRDVALASLLWHTERWVDCLVAEGPGPIVAAVEARLALRGQQVRVDDGPPGEVLGVTPDGRLRLRTASGTSAVASGRLRTL